MIIELTEIDRNNLRKVLSLNLSEEEKKFVAPNAVSIAEAYVEPGFFPRAIETSGQVVGFIMFGRWLGEESYWITRLMIDSSFRGRGYAKAAVQEAAETLFESTGCSRVSISFEPENIAARNLYLSLGFKDTGELIEGEVRFDLSRSANIGVSGKN